MKYDPVRKNDLVIKNGLVIQEDHIQKTDIGIASGIIQKIGPDLDGDEVIDARDLYVIPGGIDPHVHLEMRAGEITSSDDWESGTIAAAIGGTTTVIDFIEPGKTQSLMDALDERKARAENRAVIDYSMHMTLIGSVPSQFKGIQNVVNAGITSFKTYTTYGIKLTDAEMISAMTEVNRSGGMVMTHCENDAIIEYLRHQLILEGKVTPQYHPFSRPVDAEGEAVERVIALANTVHVPVYIVHISTSQGVDAIQRARSRGQTVWGETCPQYLLLTEDEYKRPGFEPAKYLCQPPLRSKENNIALWKGLAEDTLQTIGTDHCPFFYNGQKDRGKDLFTKIPGGMPGIESRLCLTFTYGVGKGIIDLIRWVEVISGNPAKIFGLYPRKGCLLPGSDADIVLFDPNKSGVISREMLHENVDYTPYEGFLYQGYPVMTIAAGQVIARNGEFTGKGHKGKFISRKPDDHGKFRTRERK